MEYGPLKELRNKIWDRQTPDCVIIALKKALEWTEEYEILHTISGHVLEPYTWWDPKKNKAITVVKDKLRELILLEREVLDVWSKISELKNKRTIKKKKYNAAEKYLKDKEFQKMRWCYHISFQSGYKLWENTKVHIQKIENILSCSNEEELEALEEQS